MQPAGAADHALHDDRHRPEAWHPASPASRAGRPPLPGEALHPPPARLSFALPSPHLRFSPPLPQTRWPLHYFDYLYTLASTPAARSCRSYPTTIQQGSVPFPTYTKRTLYWTTRH